MTLNEYRQKMMAVPRGQFTHLALCSDLQSKMKAKYKKAGRKLFRQSVVVTQARIPYKSIAEVRKAIEEGKRDAPKLPFAASGIYSVDNGVITYTPKNPAKGLLVGFRAIDTLSSRFVDGNGISVSNAVARDLLQPNYFTKRKSKAEHAESGTGEWRTAYLTTITG